MIQMTQTARQLPPAETAREERTAALTRMTREYGDSLLRLCCLYIGEITAAEDALQETFLSAFRHYDEFRHECSEKTWLTGIAVNVCRSYWRREKRRMAFWQPIPEGDGTEQCPDPAAEVIYDDTVLREIHALKPAYREVILMFYYQEMSAKEIASALGISESAVTVRLSRGRDKLKEKLKIWYYD